MKKIIEVEYVGIEDVQEILDDTYAVSKHTKHYVSVSMSNGSTNAPLVHVLIMLDGFDKDGLYDYDYLFRINDDEISVTTMKNCKNTLRNLLAEE